MTGKDLIEFIQNNHLEEYEIVVSHETGESAYSVMEIEPDHIHKTIELI